MRYRHILVISLALVTSANGCKDRYFSDRDAAVNFLTAHRAEFEDLAEAWAAGRPEHPPIFCKFDSGDIRWGQVFIRKTGRDFSIETNGEKQTAASLEEAVKRVGASYSVVSHWIEMATKYKIYSIGEGSDSTVQILLCGSDWSPYGFRYAPKTNSRGYDTLIHYARQGGMENTDRRMEQVFGRWFHFEAKR